MKKIMILLSILLMMVFTGCETVGKPTVYHENVTLGQFKYIKVSTDRVDFRVVQEDREDVLIKLSTFDNGAKLDVEENDNGLDISTSEKENTQINVVNTGGSEIIVSIPYKYKNELKIKSDTGDGILKELALEKVEVDMGSGDLVLKEVDNKELDVEMEKGEVELEIGNSDFRGSINMNAGDGKINVYSQGNKRKYEGKYIEEIGDEDKEINIKTDGGDIEIRE